MLFITKQLFTSFNFLITILSFLVSIGEVSIIKSISWVSNNFNNWLVDLLIIDISMLGYFLWNLAISSKI